VDAQERSAPGHGAAPETVHQFQSLPESAVS
jgi:hypothetical protein